MLALKTAFEQNFNVASVCFEGSIEETGCRFQMPKFEMPKFEMPKFEFDMPSMPQAPEQQKAKLPTIRHCHSEPIVSERFCVMTLSAS